MKDKTITTAHFDYTNNLVKILGLGGLGDFEKSLPYSILKSNQNDICNRFTKSIGDFKKLFPLEGFDLRKINYSFENIDQVIGFLKKIFIYLDITFDYSRIKGTPTLRLIPPNNLYSKYIMNLREIPQNQNVFSQHIEELKLMEKISIGTNQKELKDMLQQIPSFEPDESEKFTKVFELIGEPIKQNEIISSINISDIIEQFEKKNITKKIISGNNFNFNQIGVDWIRGIKINFSDGSELPHDTSISLMINQEELFLCKIPIEKHSQSEYIPINLPNNFLYPSNSISLSIGLPENLTNPINSSNPIEELTNENKYQIEFDGYNVLNKSFLEQNYLNNIFFKQNDLLYSKKIIRFDHEPLYSQNNLDLGIYNQTLSIGIEDYKYKKINNAYGNEYGNSCITKYSNQTKTSIDSTLISMSYILSYLKKPFEKKYKLANRLEFNLLPFNYFNWIGIRKESGDKLSVGTEIKFCIGGIEELNYAIKTDTQFDLDNYYRFQIDFPNVILYKYHQSELLINELEQKEKKYSYDIIVYGSQFKTTLPKKIPNSNILFDHDSKWFVGGEKRYVSIGGMVTNTKAKNDFTIPIPKSSHLDSFKKHEQDDKVTTNIIQLKSGTQDNLIFMDNEPNQITQDLNGLIYLVDSSIREYFKSKKYLKNNIPTYSFGSNAYFEKNKFPDVCEIMPNNKYRLFYVISRTGDLVKHFDIYLESDIKSQYNFNAWIEYENQIIFNFGINKTDKKIRLGLDSQLINLANKQLVSRYLVIEIPENKFSDWKQIDLCAGFIYSDTENRRKLINDEDPFDNIIIQ